MIKIGKDSNSEEKHLNHLDKMARFLPEGLPSQTPLFTQIEIVSLIQMPTLSPLPKENPSWTSLKGWCFFNKKQTFHYWYSKKTWEQKNIRNNKTTKTQQQQRNKDIPMTVNITKRISSKRVRNRALGRPVKTHWIKTLESCWSVNISNWLQLSTIWVTLNRSLAFYKG